MLTSRKARIVCDRHSLLQLILGLMIDFGKGFSSAPSDRGIARKRCAILHESLVGTLVYAVGKGSYVCDAVGEGSYACDPAGEDSYAVLSIG